MSWPSSALVHGGREQILACLPMSGSSCMDHQFPSKGPGKVVLWVHPGCCLGARAGRSQGLKGPPLQDGSGSSPSGAHLTASSRGRAPPSGRTSLCPLVSEEESEVRMVSVCLRFYGQNVGLRSPFCRRPCCLCCCCFVQSSKDPLLLDFIVSLANASLSLSCTWQLLSAK